VDDDDEFRRLDRDQSPFGNTPVRKLQLFRARPAAASAATNSRKRPGTPEEPDMTSGS